ncbi:hypothetical protein B0H21DRAFT_754287 [Amylocystis lapponica]|nr:hypothetical protein B0H21DRAFT_754287 [Amylocystis lapponica]
MNDANDEDYAVPNHPQAVDYGQPALAGNPLYPPGVPQLLYPPQPPLHGQVPPYFPPGPMPGYYPYQPPVIPYMPPPYPYMFQAPPGFPPHLRDPQAFRAAPYAPVPLAVQPPAHPPAQAPAPLLPAQAPAPLLPGPPAPVPPRAAGAAAPAGRTRPNAEISPGVYSIMVFIHTPKVIREFSIDTNISWDDIFSRVCGYLDKPATAGTRIGYKLNGAAKGLKPFELTSVEDWKTAMTKVCDAASRARTIPVEISIFDLEPSPSEIKTGKRRRTRADDIPPGAEAVLNSAYNKLTAHLQCESHHGSCYVTRSGVHMKLDHSQLTAWAKGLTTGEATLYTPPHIKEIEGSNKRARTGGPSSLKHDIIVQINQVDGATTTATLRPTLTDHNTNVPLPMPAINAVPSTSSKEPTQPRILSDTARQIETRPDVVYPETISLLRFIQMRHPNEDYIGLLNDLLNIGFTHVDDITIIPELTLHDFTLIPPSKILTIYHFAAQIIELFHRGRWEVVAGSAVTTMAGSSSQNQVARAILHANDAAYSSSDTDGTDYSEVDTESEVDELADDE